jgi:hypothetical protein
MFKEDLLLIFSHVWLTRLATACLLYVRGLELGDPRLLAEALRQARSTSREMIQRLRCAYGRTVLLHVPELRTEDLTYDLAHVARGFRPRELYVSESEIAELADDLVDLILYGDATLDRAIRVASRYVLQWLPELRLRVV